jgi:hypothetical protein
MEACMPSLANSMFWDSSANQIGILQKDRGMNFMLLDTSFTMVPLVRDDDDKSFTQFLLSNATAQKCKIAINGNFFDYTSRFKARHLHEKAYKSNSEILNNPVDVDHVEVQGQVVQNGKVIAGDSRPDSFWFGQVSLCPKGPAGCRFVAHKGDPLANSTVLAAIGGLGPLIVEDLAYGDGNKYSLGAPPDVDEPLRGEPSDAAKRYMIQRNNNTFIAQNDHSPETGKAVLAYNIEHDRLLVGLQADQDTPGIKIAQLALDLSNLGFDDAVFLDGSNSATLMVDGKVVVAPADYKDNSIVVGVGFSR